MALPIAIAPILSGTVIFTILKVAAAFGVSALVYTFSIDGFEALVTQVTGYVSETAYEGFGNVAAGEWAYRMSVKMGLVDCFFIMVAYYGAVVAYVSLVGVFKMIRASGKDSILNP